MSYSPSRPTVNNLGRSSPALEQLVGDAELVERFADRVRDDVVDALRSCVHRGDRRQDHRADLGELRERAQVTRDAAGVSRTTSTSLRFSFKHTSAARTSRLSFIE